MKRTLALITIVLAGSAYSQDPPPEPSSCTPPPGYGPSNTWTMGQGISVNISSDFTPAEIAAIQQAFANWQEAPTGSGVTFGVTVSPNPVAGPGYGPPGVYQVSPLPNLPDGAAGITLSPPSINGHRKNATTYIDTRVTSIDALERIMTHEIGHSFGLSDCPGCAPGMSVMHTPINGYNDASAIPASPTLCDAKKAQRVGRFGSVAGDPGDPGDGGGQCLACTERICIGPKDDQQCEDEDGYCCGDGFVSAADWTHTDTCGLIGWWKADSYDECADRCDDLCRKKSDCGDGGCQPAPTYCWKCPAGTTPGGDGGDPGPPGKTCAEMGWYDSDKLSDCEAACGSCGKKQWCDNGICQPAPYYCWKCS